MISILLVDDHQIVRDGLRLCLQGDDRYAVVGEAADGIEAVQRAGELQPNAIVMDVAMPGLNGIEATRQILADAQPLAKIICLSMHGDREFIAEAFRAGAAGYMIKSSAFKELLDALQEIAAGRKYISPAVADIVVDNYVRQGGEAGPAPYAVLTPRERQILQMLAEGRTAKQIGTLLNISHKTVHAFRGQLMEKIGVDSLPELTKYAIRHGLTTVE
jgi:DNA-binding NarL/FixJ family response regulator